MSEEQLIKHCSPTLAGIKTGNLFVSAYSDTNEMRADIRYWNNRLTKKGLRILPLRFHANRALIYVFRPRQLICDLQDKTACRLLREYGYGTKQPEHCIRHLMKRIGEYTEFPHEIGLFLGYPPEDVCGFIENKAKNCKCVGCWKVYGDAEKAQKIFAKYKKCTDIYSSQYARGRTIERLTIAD